MKASFYNLYINNKSKNTICFNTRIDSYCILSNADAELLKTNIEQLAIQSPKVYGILSETGFIVDCEVDEYKLLSEEYEKMVKDEKVYYLTLLPTLDCNLKCWYCFEKHIKGSHLNVRNLNSILQFVDKIFLEHSQLSELNVELFGGEPLLYFEEELYPLLKKIKEKSILLGKKISFFFVTNAVCINKNNIPLFKELDASFQISIDGYKDRHDKVKFIPETNEGTYEQIIQTIYDLTSEIENGYINLRINYDDETLFYMPELIKDLIGVDKRKIGIHLERVWQTNNLVNHRNEELLNIINLWMLNGFKVSYMNLERRSYSCKASFRNQSVISYNGSVYKCSGRDFTKEHEDGKLLEDGTIQWYKHKLEKRLGIRTFENQMCRECKFLPLCWGPCCQKQMECNDNDFTKYCQKRNMEISIADYVRYRFNNVLTEKSIHNHE